MRNVRPPIVFALAVATAASVAGVALWDQSTWRWPVLVALTLFAVVGDVLEVEARALTISGAFLAIGLAMVMLGPVPAAAVAIVTTSVDAIRRRPSFTYTVSNLATFAA